MCQYCACGQCRVHVSKDGVETRSGQASASLVSGKRRFPADGVEEIHPTSAFDGRSPASESAAFVNPNGEEESSPGGGEGAKSPPKADDQPDRTCQHRTCAQTAWRTLA